MKKPVVLIVDDEKQFTDTLAEFLSEHLNVKVLVRINALEAKEVLDTRRVDVLFQDMEIPGSGGEEVIDHIKNRKRINEMIVFVISRWNDAAKTYKFENYGGKFMPKPISLTMTQKVLIEEFEHHGGFDYKK